MKTAYEILKEAEKMSKEVIAAEVDGKVIGLSEEVADGAEVKPLTFADKEGRKKVFWHTASHILAQAVKAPLSRGKADYRSVGRQRLLL